MAIAHLQRKPRRPLLRLVRQVRRSLLRLIYFPAALLFLLLGYRFFVLGVPSRIGHLAAEVDLFLKKKALGHYGKITAFWCINPEEVANPFLLRVWAPHFILISSPLPMTLMRPFTYFSFLTIDTVEDVAGLGRGESYSLALQEWGDRPPLFQLPSVVNEQGLRVLREWGMKDGDWFVCVHSRDAVYSPKDEYLHDFRNSQIANCERAVDEIIRRGGWCIRVGEPNTPPLCARERVVNYHSSKDRSDWMDVFLAHHCRFFLGSTSGLFLLATISGRPAALVNMTPSGASLPYAAHDIAIPKHLCEVSGKIVPLLDDLSSPASCFRFSEEFQAAGYRHEENSPEEIYDLVCEMLDRLDGIWVESDEAVALQKLFKSRLKSQDFSCNTQAQWGSSYLKAEAARQTNILSEG